MYYNSFYTFLHFKRRFLALFISTKTQFSIHIDYLRQFYIQIFYLHLVVLVVQGGLGVEEGGRVLAGGEGPPPGLPERLSGGFFLRPTALADLDARTSRCARMLHTIQLHPLRECPQS